MPARKQQFEIQVAGAPVQAGEGQSVAVALMNAGLPFADSLQQRARGPWCGMGTCFACELEVDGRTQRTCTVQCQPGMKVRLGRGV